MKILWAFGWIPTLVVYTNALPVEVGARIRIIILPYIQCRKKYRDDIGIHEHELEHVRQFYQSWGRHYWWYRDNPEYRLMCEARAFAIQLHHTPGRYNYFLRMMKERYNLPSSLAIAKVYDFCIAVHAARVKSNESVRGNDP